MPVATTALNSRAPSRCRARPFSAAQPQISATASYGCTRPAPRLCVFSRHTSRVRTQWSLSRPDAVHQLLDVQHAVVAVDRLGRDAEQLRVRALLVAEDVAIRFAQEFVARPGSGRARQAGCPSCRRERTAPLPCRASRRSASSSARTVGSSPNTSSPTSAAAMAARMPGEGRVTVSLRRSMGELHLGFSFCGFPARMTTRRIIALRRTDNPVRRHDRLQTDSDCQPERLITMPLEIQRIDTRQPDAPAAIAAAAREARAERQCGERGGAAEDDRSVRRADGAGRSRRADLLRCAHAGPRSRARLHGPSSTARSFRPTRCGCRRASWRRPTPRRRRRFWKRFAAFATTSCDFKRRSCTATCKSKRRTAASCGSDICRWSASASACRAVRPRIRRPC